MNLPYIARPQQPIADIARELGRVIPWKGLEPEYSTLEKCVMYVKEIAEDGEAVLKAWHCKAKRCCVLIFCTQNKTLLVTVVHSFH
jgi:hypothetical protein